MVDLFHTIGGKIAAAIAGIFLLFSGTHVATNSQPGTQTAAVVVATQEITSTLSGATSTPTKSGVAATTTVVNNYITYPVIERTVQIATAPSGSGYVSERELTAKLNSLSDIFGKIIYGTTYPAPATNYGSGGVFNSIALSNKIDSLSGTHLSSITVSGVSGLTDADIPDGITASSYLALTGGTLSGNVTFDTDTLYIDSLNNRVGVGTSSPTDTFSVNGPIFLTNVAPANTSNRLYANASDLYWAGNLIGGATTANWTSDGTNAWRPTGNVGIGTTSPYASLSVAGATGVVANIFTATSTTATSTFSGGFSAGNNAALVVNQAATANSLYINPSGNVGVGTAGPASKLSVVTDGSGASLLLESTGASGVSASLVRLMKDGGVPVSQFGWQRNAEAFKIQTTGTMDNTGFSTAGDFVITTTGNVGIGTTSPGAKLEVSSPADATSMFEALRLTNNYNYATGRGVKMSFYPPNLINSSHLGGEIIVSNGSASAADNDMSFTTGGSSAPTEKMRILSNGNVGIGTTSPAAKLSVNQDSTGQGFYLAGYSNNTSPLFSISTSTASATSTAFVIDNNGKVGVGTSTPWKAFSVNGNVSLAGLTTSSANQTYDLCMDSDNQVIADTVAAGCISSSERFKRDVNPLSVSGLNEVMSLRPVSFYYNDSAASATEQIGFIAEEAVKVDPRLVGIGADGLPRTFKYENYTAVLTKAIQELNLKVDGLESSGSTPTPSFLQNIATQVMNLIQSAGEWAISKITGTLAIFNRVETQTAAVTNGLEMTDSATGQIYCVRITDGDLAKTPGTCLSSVTTATNSMTTPPTITLLGNNPANIDLNSSYVDPGAIATDSTGTSLMPDMQSNNVDTSKVGMYEVVWEAHDGALNYASTTRTVIVSEVETSASPEPVIGESTTTPSQ